MASLLGPSRHVSCQVRGALRATNTMINVGYPLPMLQVVGTMPNAPHGASQREASAISLLHLHLRCCEEVLECTGSVSTV